ncbi:MAG: hypothetical protein WAL37_12660 [Xanthobacteraceae bacterium]
MLARMHRMALPWLAATAIAASAVLWPAATATAAAPAERILDDSGGRIGSYLNRYEALRKSGQRVVIDGTCASACTLLLGLIPHDRICVTPRAVLAFHAAWDPSLTGAQTNAAGTKYLWSRYPDGVRRWIARHGGLRSQTIYLGGRELAAMFSSCR